MSDSRTEQSDRDSITEKRQFFFESNESMQLEANDFELTDVKAGYDWREDWHRHILEKYDRDLNK